MRSYASAGAPSRSPGTSEELASCASHETIYRRLRRDKKVDGKLWRFTRIMSNQVRKRYRGQDSRGVLPGKKHISQRPPEVLARQHLGHWEGDTVMGADQRHCVLTFVERKSGLVQMRKLNARNKRQVNRAARKIIGQNPSMFQTLTLDNGTEFHDYGELEMRFPVKIYFETP